MVVVRPPYLGTGDSILISSHEVVEVLVGIIHIRYGWRVEARNGLCETGQVRRTGSLQSGQALVVETAAVDGVDGVGISIGIGTAAVAASTIVLPSCIRHQVAG